MIDLLILKAVVPLFRDALGRVENEFNAVAQGIERSGRLSASSVHGLALIIAGEVSDVIFSAVAHERGLIGEPTQQTDPNAGVRTRVVWGSDDEGEPNNPLIIVWDSAIDVAKARTAVGPDDIIECWPTICRIFRAKDFVFQAVATGEFEIRLQQELSRANERRLANEVRTARTDPATAILPKPAVTPKQSEGNGGTGSTPTKGKNMASLADERLRSLHGQFRDAAKRFRNLRFVAVTAAEEPESLPEEDRWPCVLHNDRRHYGLYQWHWRQVLMTDSPLPPITVWLRIDGKLWQGGFFNRKRLDDPKVEFSQLKEAIDEFDRLARMAANHFGMLPSLPPPNHDLMQSNLAHRWLEAVAGMAFVSVENRKGYLVREVPDDIFTASERVIEILHSTSPTATPNGSEGNGEAGSGRPVVPEGEIVAALRGERVLQLNRQFLQAADDFRFVRCAAIRREDGERLSEEAWCGLLDAPRGASTILGQWISVEIDGQSWQASCYVKNAYWTRTPVEEKYAVVNDAAQEVQSLAASAALDFGLGSDGTPVDDRAKSWLKALLETIGPERRETVEGVFLIRDTDNFFAASARALTILKGTPAVAAAGPAIPPAPVVQATTQPRVRKQGTWAFDTEPPINSSFNKGPIEGTLAELAYRIGKEKDPQWIRDNNGTRIWVQGIDSRSYQAWFNSNAMYTKALDRKPPSRKEPKETETNRTEKSSQKKGQSKPKSG